VDAHALYAKVHAHHAKRDYSMFLDTHPFILDAHPFTIRLNEAQF